MLFKIPLLAFLLGLLPYLANARAFVPVHATLRSPFVLHAQEGYNIVLKYHHDIHQYVPVITRTKIRLPEFKLKDGNLTTLHDNFGAFYGPVNAIYPPTLAPVRFEKHPPAKSEVPIVAATQYKNGRKTLRLWGLNGRGFMLSKTLFVQE